MVKEENSAVPRTLLAEAHELMVKFMAGYDPSHDVHHVDRVTAMAVRIAKEFKTELDLTVVELGALFHDINDHKYIGDDPAKNPKDRLDAVVALLDKYDFCPERKDTVVKIIESVGFTKEKKLKASGEWLDWHENCSEFHCVSDADRLDAIGAFGVLRVAGYCCKIDRPFYHEDPTVDSALGHCYVKLFSLKDTVRTETGKRVAAKRHKVLYDLFMNLRNEQDLLDF